MQSASRCTLRQSQFYTPTPNPQTVKATTRSETRCPKETSFDAVSLATHLKTPGGPPEPSVGLPGAPGRLPEAPGS